MNSSDAFRLPTIDHDVGVAGSPTLLQSRDEPSVIQVPSPPLRRGLYPSIVKPVIDRVLALVLLVLLSPVLVACAVVIARSFGRPIFFTQERVGAGGRTFTVVKFRTMAADRRNRRVPVDPRRDRRRTHKTDDDPRLNDIGRFLRKFSLDELPQLWNVLRGEMSLVGPRPELVDIVSKYAPEVHHRHSVKPGMTGLWQISARGGGLMHENPELDLEYAERQSLLLDFWILLRTPVAALVSQRGH